MIDPSGPQSSSCNQLTGQWSPLPRCSCPLPKPSYVTVSGRNATSVLYQCNTTLGLVGNGTIACNLSTGQWDEFNCQCMEPASCQCPDPVPVVHGTVKRTNFGSISVTCNDGLQLIGKSVVFCDLSTKLWDTLPICTCQSPVPVANAHLFWTHNESVTFECKDGFDMIGQPEVTCNLPSGTWNSLPECKFENLFNCNGNDYVEILIGQPRMSKLLYSLTAVCLALISVASVGVYFIVRKKRR